MDILYKIDTLRMKKGWTIYTLAKESGLDQSTISAWFSKNRTPSIESIEKICEGFGISMSQFFADDNGLISLTPEQCELLDNWNNLSKKQRAATLQLIKDMPNNEN